MWINDQSDFIRPVLIVGIVCALVLSGGPSCSFAIAIESRHLLKGGSDGGQFQLLHWSHPEAPHYVPGLSFTEKLKLAVQSSRARVSALSNKMQLPESLAPSPAPEAGSGSLAPGPAPPGGVPAPGAQTLSFVSPLFNLVGAYAMEISIGTPPRKFSALADTGSDLVWVQCQGCDYCQPEVDPLYDPTNSSTYEVMSCSDPFCGPVELACATNKTCEYEYVYGDGTTDGVMSYETITLTTTTGTTTTANMFAFGCDYETYTTVGHVDGLVGFGQGPLSFTTQLASLYGDKFSYCLVSITDSNSSTSPLLFGDAAVPNAAIQYTPIVQNPNASYFGTVTYYYIGLKRINVNGVALDIPSGAFDIQPNGTGGVISDSGTTFTSLTSVAYAPLLAKMQSEINYKPIPFSNETIELDLCYDLSNMASPSFPTVTMVFEGFSLDLPQENVFIGGVALGNGQLNSTYCMAFADSGFGLSIFGNVQQQNFQILHDRKAKQFGYAKVMCDTLTTG